MPLLAPTPSVHVPGITPNRTTNANGLWFEVARDYAALEAHRVAWDDLGKHALEPNPFMEAFLLLPSVKFQGNTKKDVVYLFIYRANAAANGAPQMCGFFPLRRRRMFKGLPIASVQLWEHDHCFLATPLVRRDYARETWRAFLDWLATAPESAPLIEFPLLPAEGPVYQILIDEIRAQALLTFSNSSFTRGLLRARASGDAYVQEALSSNRRRDYKRKEKRLAELGSVEYRTLDAAADFDAWLEWFMKLEASGWKGEGGTALASKPSSDAFFRAAARSAFDQGQLQLLGLFLDGEPIAMRCNFLSGAGAFFFKPGYDEKHAKHSPGALLELENIQATHRKGIRFMDSCTDPDNTLINDLWLDRLIIQNLVIATGKGWGGLAVSLLPLLRWTFRLFKTAHASARRR